MKSEKQRLLVDLDKNTSSAILRREELYFTRTSLLKEQLRLAKEELEREKEEKALLANLDPNSENQKLTAEVKTLRAELAQSSEDVSKVQRDLEMHKKLEALKHKINMQKEAELRAVNEVLQSQGPEVQRSVAEARKTAVYRAKEAWRQKHSTLE